MTEPVDELLNLSYMQAAKVQTSLRKRIHSVGTQAKIYTSASTR